MKHLLTRQVPSESPQIRHALRFNCFLTVPPALEFSNRELGSTRIERRTSIVLRERVAHGVSPFSSILLLPFPQFVLKSHVKPRMGTELGIKMAVQVFKRTYRAAQSVSVAKFQRSLIENGIVQEILFTATCPFESKRYHLGPFSPYELALSLRSGSYLSHGTGGGGRCFFGRSIVHRGAPMTHSCTVRAQCARITERSD
jgi:hypothetical protein